MGYFILIPFFIITFFTSLIIFGSDSYRYPCQEFLNWEKDECHPPRCMTDGTCLQFLIDKYPKKTTGGTYHGR